MTKQLITLTPECNIKKTHRKRNIIDSKDYPSVSWGVWLHSPCAVVGGGPSTKVSLDILRNWKGDIYGVNDTAGYLSRNGIPSYAFSVDATKIPFQSGLLVKGAIFATRVNKIQFIYNNARTFEMFEDTKGTGIGGGGTTAARAPDLFFRMGYKAVVFFGMDASFSDATHVSGEQNTAFDNMMVVRINDVDFLTNASMFLQSEFLVPEIKRYPKLLINASGGMLKAMLDSKDGWKIIAIEKNLRDKTGEYGKEVWNKQYVPEEHPQGSL